MLIEATSAIGLEPRVLAALERQATSLASLLWRFEHTMSAWGPGVEPVGWWGPAQRVYAMAVDGLRAELGLARDSLQTALRETRRAVNTLDRRVG